MIYVYPKLSEKDLLYFRLIGPGLGNLLFPWARSIVAAEKNHWKTITPTWPQLKLGTFVRHDRDKRLYADLFVPGPNDITGLKKLVYLMRYKKIKEQQALQCNEKHDNTIILYEGMAGFFNEILHDHQLVNDRLLQITRGHHKKCMKFDFSHSISVHVRLGDFTTPQSINEITEGGDSRRIPIEWYVYVVKKIREQFKSNQKVYVFSDGKDEELRPLLNLANTRRLDFGSSIGDMIALSRASLLIASGSTFSMWASYLGRMPVVWHTGQLIQPLYYEKPKAETQMAIGDDLKTDFVDYIYP